jgi:4,5-DOPA dioxygenase extradiol
MTTMPAAFIGHGSPMNTLDSNRYTEAWREFGASVPTPRAILAISAHWYINASAVTSMASPRTIHDFFGFGEDLFGFQYPAPGSPELAAEVAEVVKPTWIGMDVDSWGLDHGCWSVLAHAFPAADIPVVQLSIDASKPIGYHLELGAQLAQLREQGVLIVASGNVVHNLGVLDFSQPDGGYDWAVRFEEASQQAMTGDPARMLDLPRHADWDMAVPTADHFLPVLYLAGLAHAAGTPAKVLIDGYAFGSLSMTSYVV